MIKLKRFIRKAVDAWKGVGVVKPHDGMTRPAGAPLDDGSAESFRAVQPAGFKDHAGSAIDAAIADPDMDDTKGGE